MATDSVGISGFAVYVPPYRVDLQQWCDWTNNDWSKTESVVGRSFRMRGPHQSIYTMAATSALRLIEQYDIDPTSVGFLGLGTESSTDNSAGAVIVRGMLDDALRAKGLPPLSRHCEVPEVKHACLGGVYAMKYALRYLALETEPRCAIVISADIAEYERGSSGEPTQGAGAVAVLLEREPRLLEVDLQAIGSASAYRAVDFRKPILRHLKRSAATGQFQDHPVFNGKYSTTCYLDETIHALSDMLRKLGREPADYYQDLAAVFMHRPYHRMPITSFGMSYLFGLARNGAAGRAELAEYCRTADLSLSEVMEEMGSAPDLLELARNRNLNADPYPLSTRLLRDFRSTETFQALVSEKLDLGSDLMMDLGNVYSAALPAWIAAGLEDALQTERDLAGRKVLAVGYGSGDAAEAVPMTVVPHWAEAAGRIQFEAALAGYQNLSRAQYETLHDTGEAPDLNVAPSGEFIVDAIGASSHPNYQDEGIEYYSFIT
jgi:hydroxymethylglutaryl-CoA synthase